MVSVILFIAGAIVTIGSLFFLPAPFIWIFFSWFIVFILMARSTKKPFTRMLFFYLCFIPFTFGIYESYLWLSQGLSNAPPSQQIRNHQPEKLTNG